MLLDRLRKARFERDVLKYLDTLHFSALQMCGDEDTAADLVQDTFLKAYSSYRRGQEIRNVKAWLYRIMVNGWINFRKTRQRHILVEDVGEFLQDASGSGFPNNASSLVSPEEYIGRKLLWKDCLKALEDLPLALRLVVVLSDLEGFSYKEISQILNCPLGTVMSRLHRARKALQESLLEHSVKGR